MRLRRGQTTVLERMLARAARRPAGFNRDGGAVHRFVGGGKSDRQFDVDTAFGTSLERRQRCTFGSNLSGLAHANAVRADGDTLSTKDTK